jgi:hypothetical protein
VIENEFVRVQDGPEDVLPGEFRAAGVGAEDFGERGRMWSSKLRGSLAFSAASDVSSKAIKRGFMNGR